MILPVEKNVCDETETEDLAKVFLQFLKPGQIIALVGNLGTGKTFFVKSVCKELGIDGVTSPTFSIVNEYSGKYEVNHFDFFRIKKLEELYDIGFEEYLTKNNCLTFIEWADMFYDILPRTHIKIEFKHIDLKERIIKIEEIS
jgi:tRNA threonylcarbamoyladenosine biosynthesis protein TsaE